jgi:glycosyltransferase involved in cell wall biosynthesis
MTLCISIKGIAFLTWRHQLLSRNIALYISRNMVLMIRGFSAMRILVLTAHLPFPPLSGGRRREFELISRLGTNYEIHLCAITKSWQTDNKYVNELRNRCASVDLFKALASDAGEYSLYPNQIRKHISEEATLHISTLLRKKRFDVVHVEGYYLMQNLPTVLHVPILLVEHNIECLLQLQRFMLASNQDEKFYYWKEYIYTLKWEAAFWKRATICVTLTNDDKRCMSQLQHGLDIRTIPDGTDHQKVISCTSPLCDVTYINFDNNKYPSILFVANFAYEPNVDAALYFSDVIFPLILKKVPKARLFLVGNAPPTKIKSLSANKQIEVTGFVNSLIPYYEAANVVICPLRIGGGIKVKILEALNAGKAIVSTSIGAQGLDLNTCQALAIADEASDFAKKVVEFLTDPNERYRQEQEALTYSKMLPSWQQVSQQFANFYNEMSSHVQKQPSNR